VEYWKGGPKADAAATYIDGAEAAIVSTVNIAEVYHWILAHYDAKTAEEKKATIKRRCFVVPVSEDIAVEAARTKYARKIALADSLILATAKSAGAEVVTGDANFKGLDGLIYIGQ